MRLKIENPKNWTTAIASAAAALAAFAIFMPSVKIQRNFPEGFSSFTAIAPIRGGEGAEIAMHELFDYSPMFIPTRWNYLQGTASLPPPVGPDTLAKPENSKAAIEIVTAEFLSDQNREISDGKSGMLASVLRSVFSSRGRAPKSPAAAPENGGFKLVDMRTGKVVRNLPLDRDTALKMASMAEFLVSVSDEGGAEKPFLRESAGSESLDAALARRLTRVDLLKDVASGFYKAIFIP